MTTIYNRLLHSRAGRVLAASVLVALCASCGSSAPSAPSPTATPSPSPTPTPTPSPSPTASSGPPTISITNTGLTPLEITIDVGARVTFVNNDVLPHDLSGGVDPAHPECPEVDVAGFLTPGQTKASGAFMTAQVCQYHDHTRLGVAAYQGRIVVR